MCSATAIVSSLLEDEDPKDYVDQFEPAVDGYERIVFLQGEEADRAFALEAEDGLDSVMDYLKQWYYPGEHEIEKQAPWGTGDTVRRRHDTDGEFCMSYNHHFGYIGLVRVIRSLRRPDDPDRNIS